MPESWDPSPKLLDRVPRTCRRRQYSLHTERAYTRWGKRFVRFHDTTHPHRLDEDDVRTFLNHLTSDRNVAASTQNQALNALVFLYEQGLDAALDNLGAPSAATTSPERLWEERQTQQRAPQSRRLAALSERTPLGGHSSI